MEPHRPNLTNLNPVFCKKHMSISSRRKSLFFGPHIFFFGRQNWLFLMGLAKCQNWGANVRNEEQRGNWLLYMYAMINDHQNSNDAQYTSILTFAPRLLHLLLNFNIGWSIIIACMISLQYPHSSLLLNSDICSSILTLDSHLEKIVAFEVVKPPKKQPKKIYGFLIHIKNTFCKKIGQKRSIQPSAVANIIYIRLYGVATTN